MWLIMMVSKSPKAFLWLINGGYEAGMILQVDKVADMHLEAYDGQVLHGF